MSQKVAQVYQIRVSLNRISPPIWRRILVPGDATLGELHAILQAAMGWDNYHLHEYTIEGTRYGNPHIDQYDALRTLDEDSHSLSEVLRRKGQRFRYEYDFGDSWEHTLLVEEILSARDDDDLPRCLAGKRACPPEDVGGPWGYANFLETIEDPDHPDREQLVEWISGSFDPEAFDLDAINRRLRAVSAFADVEPSGQSESGNELVWATESLLTGLSPEQIEIVEELPLRRDVVALLTYLRDNKVKGTASTGNLPLKAVREICARFVDPPALERTIGERVHRIRSESDLPPLLFRHMLASAAELIEGGPGQIWKLTEFGAQYLTAFAGMQVWLLFAVWWMDLVWLVASANEYGDAAAPADLERAALTRLLQTPVGKLTPFAEFANAIISDVGLACPIEDQRVARLILHSIVENVVIDPQIDFGVVEPEYGPDPILGDDIQRLSAFRVTPFGRSMLPEFRP